MDWSSSTIALGVFLTTQAAAAVWWASETDTKLDATQETVTKVVENATDIAVIQNDVVTIKEMMEDAGFKQIRFIEWIKTNPVPINSKRNYLTNAREVALLGVKVGKPTFHSKYDNAIYRYAICQDKGRFHPTQKPLKFMEALIEKHSNPGEIVVDTFAGSATTLLAASKLGRGYMGCELDPDCYAKALDRMNKA